MGTSMLVMPTLVVVEFAALVGASLAENVAGALVALALITITLSIAIWRQNRRGFERLEKLLLAKSDAAQVVIDERPQ